MLDLHTDGLARQIPPLAPVRHVADRPWRGRSGDLQGGGNTFRKSTIGSTAGGLGYEIEDASGDVARTALLSGKNSFVTAVAPVVLAVQAMVEGRFQSTGLVLPDQQVEPSELVAQLRSSGVEVVKSDSAPDDLSA